MTSSLFTQSSELIAMNARKETYPEMKAIEQQSALYSYFNQASAMQLFAPQLFAHQTLMSSWPFHPTFFSGWPLAAPLPYASPPADFTGLNQMSEAIHSNYLSPKDGRIQDENSSEKDEVKRSSYSSYSGSVSPVSTFNDFANNRTIEKKDSPKNKIFECKTCNKTFGYKHVLQNHEKTHTGEKNYRCTKCNKCFRRDHHLKVHMRLHSGEKPYVCTVPTCDRQFVQVANLRRHLKTHENANRLSDHESLIVSKEQISHTPFHSESSLDSVDMMKTQNKFDFTSYTETFSTVETSYEVPEQSEPEDLSVKSNERN
jgi:uncharacterized Zn-finger protein